MRYLKSSLLLSFGIGWIAFALAIALFAFLYLSDGAGTQFFGFFPFSSFTFVMGFAQFTGLIFGAFLCLLIGIWLCLYGLVPPSPTESTAQSRPNRSLPFLHGFKQKDQTLHCVDCEIAFDAPVRICPQCGWTQPHSHVT